MDKSPLRVIQQWKGWIDEIDGEMIYATMQDLTNPLMPDESWMFSSTNISEDQKCLLDLGVPFTFDIWSNSTWVIKITELPKWTQEEIDALKKKAAKLREEFGLAPRSVDTTPQ